MSGHHCHARESDGKVCSVLTKPEMLMCKAHWSLVPRELQRRVWDTYRPGQCDDKKPSAAWHAAADACIAHVRAIVKIKGYEEHGSYPSPQAAICAVCGQLAWLCIHPWEMRLPQERWEATARGLPWPCKPADLAHDRECLP